MREVFEDAQVRLRPYRSQDVDALDEAARESVADVHPWLPWCHPAYSREDAQGWVLARPGCWERGEGYEFVVEDARSGRYLGGCGLNQLDPLHRRANLGYWVRSSAAGEGVATRAVRLIARFGLEDLGLIRLEIIAAVGNLASQRVAEKAGARREGVLRARLLLHGRAHDAVSFSIVAPQAP